MIDTAQEIFSVLQYTFWHPSLALLTFAVWGMLYVLVYFNLKARCTNREI